jgi:hypothetical protein
LRLDTITSAPASARALGKHQAGDLPDHVRGLAARGLAPGPSEPLFNLGLRRETPGHVPHLGAVAELNLL